jgi:putative transposase
MKANRRTPLNKKYRTKTKAARKKRIQQLPLQCGLPIQEFVAGFRADIEAFSAQLGLQVIGAVMEEEIAQQIGPWGQQVYHRHGTQEGYVSYAGRKLPVERPRARSLAGKEAKLKTYEAFQQNGRMQQAVASKMLRQVSTRNYQGALEDCLDGYGIDKSSVSRQWKSATAAELEKLCSRPVPNDLAVLLIDAKHLRQDCAVVALGIDYQAKKQVLGLWHGATENTTVAKALLEDLVERGLDSSRSILVIIDGAKALRRAVADVFGPRALVQRCRIHKRRNVLEHLAPEKQRQAAWRLKAAWAESDPDKALSELQKVVRWLEAISPAAARSLEEGLEETITLNRLGLHEDLIKSLSSTNLIESCFSGVEDTIKRVKRWRDAEMFLRWMGAGLLFAESRFRKIRGFRHFPQLIAALNNHSIDTHQIAA